MHRLCRNAKAGIKWRTLVPSSSFILYIQSSHNPQASTLGRNYLHKHIIRSNRIILREGNFRMNVRKTFLTVRDFRLQNSLPKEVVETPVLRTFKKHWTNHWKLYCRKQLGTTRKKGIEIT